MRSFPRALHAVCLSAGLLAAVSAQAAPQVQVLSGTAGAGFAGLSGAPNVSTLYASNQFGSLNSGTIYGFQDSFSAGTASFSDDFSFSVPSTSSGISNVTGLDIVFDPGTFTTSVTNLASLTLQLFQGNVGSGVAVTGVATAWANGAVQLTFANLLPSNNPYYLEVAGTTAAGTLASSFTGVIAVTNSTTGTVTSPVPEPGTLPLLLAGGLAGLLRVRRRMA